MKQNLSLEELWDASPESSDSMEGAFEAAHFQHFPPAAQCYLTHAIAPGTRLASAVRLTMHGTIKAKHWLPFTAEQVIRWHRGMIWRATVYNYGLPILGSDQLIDGESSMSWKLFGIFPVMHESGSDTPRCTIGRVQIESLWLPSVLCHSEVAWTQTDSLHPHARISMHGETARLDLALETTGRVKTASLLRWGNPEGAVFPYVSFGGILENERVFESYTIPTHARVGWYFGTERFESEGELFRATIDSALFR